jgi:hypothetical protein
MVIQSWAGFAILPHPVCAQLMKRGIGMSKRGVGMRSPNPFRACRSLAVTGPNQLRYANLTYIRLRTVRRRRPRKVVGVVSHLLRGLGGYFAAAK